MTQRKNGHDICSARDRERVTSDQISIRQPGVPLLRRNFSRGTNCFGGERRRQPCIVDENMTPARTARSREAKRVEASWRVSGLDRGGRRGSEGTSGDQREPEGTRGDQREPEGPRGNQRGPEGVRRPWWCVGGQHTRGPRAGVGDGGAGEGGSTARVNPRSTIIFHGTRGP